MFCGESESLICNGQSCLDAEQRGAAGEGPSISPKVAHLVRIPFLLPGALSATQPEPHHVQDAAGNDAVRKVRCVQLLKGT